MERWGLALWWAAGAAALGVPWGWVGSLALAPAGFAAGWAGWPSAARAHPDDARRLGLWLGPCVALALLPDLWVFGLSPLRCAWGALLWALVAVGARLPWRQAQAWPWGKLVAGGLVAGWAASCVVSFLQYTHFGDPLARDSAYYHQIFWSATQGDGAWRGSVLHHLYHDPPLEAQWAVHVTPIAWVIWPLYKVWPSLYALLAVRDGWVMLGGWAMFLLARRRLGGMVAAVLTAAMLATPTLMYQPLNSFYFYISALAPFLFAWYFHEERRLVPFLLCCAWLLTAREDMGLAVGALGALAGWERWREAGRGRWAQAALGGVVSLVGLAWWVGMVKFVMPRYGSAAGEATLSWYAGWGGSPKEMLGRLVGDPGFVASVLLTRLKVSYAWAMLRASGGLGAMGLPALLSAPFWAVNLLVTRPQAATANMFYHYSTLLIAASYAAVPRAVARWSAWRGAGEGARGGRAWVLAVFVLAMSASTAPLVYTRAQVGVLLGGEEAALFERVLAQVPPDGRGVAAPSRMLPNLVEGHPMLLASDRPMGYTSTRLAWVILAEGEGTYPLGDWSEARWEEYFDSFRRSPEYERVYAEGGYVVYRRRD